MDDGRTPRSGQTGAIVAGAQELLRQSRLRERILRAVLQAIDQFDAVTELIGASDSADAARAALMDRLGIDEVQARAVAGLQVLKLARRERQQLTNEHNDAMTRVADLESILASPERQQELLGTERGNYLAGHAPSGAETAEG